MNIFNKLFGIKRPVLKRNAISDFEKVAEFVIWFIKNEPIANAISNRSSNIIFNEGYRPKLGAENNPKSVETEVNSLAELFIIKVFIDLNMLKDTTKEEFRKFIDSLAEAGKKTLITAGEISRKYDLNFGNFVYDREIEKIPTGIERELFKINLLEDNVLGAEIRILAWLYHKYFNEWYQIEEKRRYVSDSRRGNFHNWSALSLIYPIAVTLYISTQTSAKLPMVLGYGIGNLGFVMVLAGIFAGTFHVFSIHKRWLVYVIGLISVFVGIILSSISE